MTGETAYVLLSWLAGAAVIGIVVVAVLIIVLRLIERFSRRNDE